MKLAHKLLLAPLLTAVVLLGVGQANNWLTGRQASATQRLNEQQVLMHKALGDSQGELARLHAEVYRTMTLVASLDEAKVKAVRSQLLQRATVVKKNLAGVAAATGNADLKRLLADAAGQIDLYVKHADGAIDLATVDANTGIAAMQNADAAFAALGQVIAKVATAAEAETVATVDAAAAQSRQLNWGLGLAGLLFAGVAIAMAHVAQRRFAAEIVDASRVAGEVAKGHLNQHIDSRRADEVGELVRALAAMQAQLRTLVGDVRSSADNISLASSEVASGNLDLSQRTEQTASNLQQAAASLDQLTVTVRQSADSANTANQLAASAAQVAQRGGAVVAQVVSTMDEINVASKKISDIIAVIDGIAFQTNILALNAAVEAARAGEQGRGFAVVAAEVRSLAQRSAQAAKEIKGLIGASVEKVDTGSKLVADAGSTMGEIVASVQRVSDIIGEITAAATEQSQGIGQVNQAVTQLDQMTQQNAALVEQSAAAAESLKDQAGKLTGVMAQFKLQPAGG